MSAPTTEPSTIFSPPALARRWNVRVQKVLVWIRRGEIPGAMDLSERTGIGRPRYKVPLDGVLAFEERRRVKPPVRATRKRKGVEIDRPHFR